MLAVAGFVLPLLNDVVTEVATQQGNAWVGRLIRREPEPVQLSQEQARRVQVVAFEQARRAGLDDNRARLVADSIVGAVAAG